MPNSDGWRWSSRARGAAACEAVEVPLVESVVPPVGEVAVSSAKATEATSSAAIQNEFLIIPSLQTVKRVLRDSHAHSMSAWELWQAGQSLRGDYGQTASGFQDPYFSKVPCNPPVGTTCKNK
jgi:hypothetical protein